MINVDIALLKELTRGYSDIIKKLEDSNKDIIEVRSFIRLSNTTYVKVRK